MAEPTHDERGELLRAQSAVALKRCERYEAALLALLGHAGKLPDDADGIARRYVDLCERFGGEQVTPVLDHVEALKAETRGAELLRQRT